MSGGPAFWLTMLPTWIFAFTLVLARCAGATLLLPAFGESIYPPIVRAELALAVTIVVVPDAESLIPDEQYPAFVSAYMIIAEVITGLWLGWFTRMVYVALPMSAQIISYLLGLSSVLQPNSEQGPENTALAALFQILAPLVVIVSGLYSVPIMAIRDSYHLIPPGALVPPADDLRAVVRAVAQSFSVSLRLASPFVVAGIVWHLVTGFMARLVPRLQVYFIAIPGQILVGLVLLTGVGGVLLAVWEDAVRDSLAALPIR